MTNQKESSGPTFSPLFPERSSEILSFENPEDFVEHGHKVLKKSFYDLLVEDTEHNVLVGIFLQVFGRFIESLDQRQIEKVDRVVSVLGSTTHRKERTI